VADYHDRVVPDLVLFRQKEPAQRRRHTKDIEIVARDVHAADAKRFVADDGCWNPPLGGRHRLERTASFGNVVELRARHVA
jgi:hypothetical protein